MHLGCVYFACIQKVNHNSVPKKGEKLTPKQYKALQDGHRRHLETLTYLQWQENASGDSQKSTPGTPQILCYSWSQQQGNAT